MVEPQQYYGAPDSDNISKTRDLEEKVRLLKDRILLIGRSLVEERDKNFKEIQEMKTLLIKMQEENIRMKEVVQRIIEQLESTARKEDLMICARSNIERGISPKKEIEKKTQFFAKYSFGTADELEFYKKTYRNLYSKKLKKVKK